MKVSDKCEYVRCGFLKPAVTSLMSPSVKPTLQNLETFGFKRFLLYFNPLEVSVSEFTE